MTTEEINELKLDLVIKLDFLISAYLEEHVYKDVSGPEHSRLALEALSSALVQLLAYSASMRQVFSTSHGSRFDPFVLVKEVESELKERFKKD